MLTKRSALLLASLAAASCSASPAVRGPVEVVDDATLSAEVINAPAVPGAVVQIRFANSGPTRYWFSPCSRTVERLVDDRWTELPAELRLCTMEAHEVPASGEVVKSTDVPADAVPGHHRFVFNLTADDSGAVVVLRSAAFEVR